MQWTLEEELEHAMIIVIVHPVLHSAVVEDTVNKPRHMDRDNVSYHLTHLLVILNQHMLILLLEIASEIVHMVKH